MLSRNKVYMKTILYAYAGMNVVINKMFQLPIGSQTENKDMFLQKCENREDVDKPTYKKQIKIKP